MIRLKNQIIVNPNDHFQKILMQSNINGQENDGEDRNCSNEHKVELIDQNTRSICNVNH